MPDPNTKIIMGILEEFDEDDIALAIKTMGISLETAEEINTHSKIDSIRDFSNELRNSPILRSEFNENPEHFLKKTEINEDDKKKINQFNSLLDALQEDKAIIYYNEDDKPVLKIGNEDDKELKQENKEVVLTTGRTFHSVARKDCQYTCVSRKSSAKIIVETNLTIGIITSSDIVTQSAVKVELEKLLQSELTAEVRASLKVSYGLSETQLTTVASMTKTEIERFVQSIITTTTTVVTVYTVPITGTLTIHEQWDVQELWNWVGEDCQLTLSVPESNNYQVSGDKATYPVDTTIVIREVHAPSVKARGNEWAKVQGNEAVNRLIKGGSFLPEPPPASVSRPLNFR